MQISDVTNAYVGSSGSTESMTGARGVERLVASVRNLTAGNIFEGTVNTIKGNQVVLGLSNGSVLSARLEADLQLTQGQSMFFQVKTNDGTSVAIRPYLVDGNGANLTLLNALKAANLPVTDKYLNLANSMMQEQLPIDKNTMSQMARVLMANPDMSVQSLVLMKKHNIPITNEMVAVFENYMDDTGAVHSAIDKFMEELPNTLSGKSMSLEQQKAFDSQLLQILAEGGDEAATGGLGQASEGSAVQTQGDSLVGQTVHGQGVLPEGMSEGATVTNNPVKSLTEEALQMAGESRNTLSAGAEGAGVTEETLQQAGSGVLGAGEEAIATGENGINAEAAVNAESNKNIALTAQEINQEKVQAFLKELYGDLGITSEDSPSVLLQKLANHIATGQNVSEDSLQSLFQHKDFKELLRNVLEKQFFLEPEEAADGNKLKKLYDRLDNKVQSLETLLQNGNLKDTALAQTLSDIHANLDFMHQINQTYTFAQIPLKMSNQNASGQLYVYTNKRNLEDPERDLTAFLHLDLEHLGATDVSVRMHKREVSTKFYMDSDASYELAKAHMPELEARLRAKGYNCKIEVEKEGGGINFVEDFLKKDAPPTGQLHRYSFDVRA